MAEARARRTLLRRLEDQVLRETGNRYERLLLLPADGTLLWRKDGLQPAEILWNGLYFGDA